MFKNKHVIVALLVAPMLAIIAYFSVDYFVKEQPHKAKTGNAYELAAKSNCRYGSGRCELSNGDFKVVLSANHLERTLQINLKSNFALDAVKIGIISPQKAPIAPLSMQALNQEKNLWQAEFKQPESHDSQIRLAVILNQVKYYAETGMKFTIPENFLPNHQELRDRNKTP